MQNSRKLFVIGVTALIALVVLIAGIEFLKGVNVFKNTRTFYATYSNASGLSQSAKVTVNGFKVGQVVAVDYDYENLSGVTVKMELDKEMRVPEGTVAVLTSDLLGSPSIVLEIPAADGQVRTYVESGSTLPGKIASGLMDSLSGDLLPSVAAVIPKVDSLLTAVTALVGDPAVTAAIQRLDDITRNLNATTSALAQTVKPLPAVIGNVHAITANLATMSANLDSIAVQIKEMPLGETVNSIQAIALNLKNVTDRLQSSESSLGLLINNPDLYNNLNATVSSLDSLFIDIKANPKRYINIKLL